MCTKKFFIKIFITIILLLALILWTFWNNTALELNTYTISSNRLPQVFDGFKIAHVSDLHNTEIGKNNNKLLKMLNESAPDIITITGDIIDSYSTNITIALNFAEKALEIAPCYYVTGNHEARTEQYKQLKTGLKDLGVTVLDDETVILKKSDQTIVLMGINDPSFKTDYLLGDSKAVVDKKLHELKNDNYTILLSHRPELFDTYVKNDIDLVLSGHAHGGQFRLPFIGGLIAPNQGFFPKYDEGLFFENNTSLLVSRGIGNSIIPFRFNNRPEVILIELKNPQTQ